MFDASEMTERHARALGEFSELCLASARDLAARQLATEDAAEAAELASALHKVGRSLRQSMALEARLRRDQEQGVREAQDRKAQADLTRRRHRRAQVEAAFERLSWDEGFDYDEDDLSEILDVDILAETFGQLPLDRQIVNLCKRMGLEPPQRLGPAKADTDEAPQDTHIRPPPPLDDDFWRSSA